MKAAQLKKFKASDAITIAEVERPPIGDRCVLVEVYAAGINPADYKVRDGYFQHQLPMIMGGDFSGVVIDVGKNALAFQPGDEVYGGASVFRNGSGSFAEYCVAEITTIAYKSKSISHTEAAAYPLAGISALEALTEHIRLAKGQKILIHGGAGGIGHFAIQIAKNIGAFVATTVRSEDADFVKKLGADQIIDYKREKFEEKVNGFDCVFDTVGGDIYKRSFNAVHKGGVIVSMTTEPDRQLMNQYDVKSIVMLTKITTERLDKLTLLVDSCAIKTHIDRDFELNQVNDALNYLQQNHPQGKITLKIR